MADQNFLLNTITNSHNFNFTNIVLPSQKASKSMGDFSDYPAILFAMFRRGSSISDPSVVDMAPCRSVAILFNREAGVFFRESPPSALRVENKFKTTPLSTYLPTHLPTYPPTKLPCDVTNFLHKYAVTYTLPTYLPTHTPTYPSTHLQNTVE